MCQIFGMVFNPETLSYVILKQKGVKIDERMITSMKRCQVKRCVVLKDMMVHVKASLYNV